MSTQIHFAEIYQLSLQLVCLADRWSHDASERRQDVRGLLMGAATTAVLLLAKGVGESTPEGRRALLRRADHCAIEVSSLIDVSGVLHLMAPTELQRARTVTRCLRERITALLESTPGPMPLREAARS